MRAVHRAAVVGLAFLGASCAGLLWPDAGRVEAREAGLKGKTDVSVTSVKNVNKAGDLPRQEVKFVVYSEYWETDTGVKADIYHVGLLLVTGEPIVNEGRATLASLGAVEDDPNDTTLWDGKAFTATFGSLVHQERYSYEVQACLVRVASRLSDNVSYASRPNCLVTDANSGVECFGAVGNQPPAVHGFSLVWGTGSPTSSLGHVGGSGTYGNPSAPTVQGYAGNSAEVIIAWQASGEAYYKVYDPEVPGTTFECWTDVLPAGTWSFNLFQIRICESQLTLDPTPASFAATFGSGLVVNP
jgi:hypothetical protein